MKDAKDVIQEFNELVNMTAAELETWLKSDESGEAGWPKDDGGGESVGHESGRKITEILKSNPSKNPQKYNDDQISHMRKVVAYCKRHLAQEEGSLKSKSEVEAKKTKSYISLKNWGHDPLKKDSSKEANKGSKADGAEQAQEEQENGDKEGENRERENGEKEDEEEEKPGDKRKRSEKSGGPEPKKHRVGSNSKEHKADSNDDDSGESEDNEKANKESKSKTSNGPNPGETVSWNWGNGQPEGKVLDVQEEKTTITTKRGNQVSREGTREDPAVILDTGKSKAIKSAHELN